MRVWVASKRVKRVIARSHLSALVMSIALATKRCTIMCQECRVAARYERYNTAAHYSSLTLTLTPHSDTILGFRRLLHILAHYPLFKSPV